MARLLKCELLTPPEISALCDLARPILQNSPNVIAVKSPVNVCGDIHGQFNDLLELFKIGGMPPHCNYLFMGDFVDRGLHSVETVLLLLALKIMHPEHVHLLRGNHECRQITQIYGFYDEIIRKFGDTRVWRTLTDLFDFLPLAATIDDKIFCVHGGLSPSFKMIDEVQHLDRTREIPHEGTMADLLWSDPDEIRGFGASPRGAGFSFGENVTEDFLQANNLNLLCRAHQLMMEGHSYTHSDSCLTLFSAPNYCGRCMNKASFMEVNSNGKCEITDFVSVPEELDAWKSRLPDYFI